MLSDQRSGSVVGELVWSVIKGQGQLLVNLSGQLYLAGRGEGMGNDE